MSGLQAARRIVLARRPDGKPVAGDFAIETIDLPEPEDGQLLLETRYISVDPMIALLIGKAPLGGTLPSFPIGGGIPGAAVSRVVASRSAEFAVGDLVEGRSGWQDRAVMPAAAMRRIDPAVGRRALGAAGLPGFTAWLGIDLLGDVAGSTILISGAAGAVGSIAGQLARLCGARVIGLASTAARRAYLTGELGFDAAFDHAAPDLAAALQALGGIDVYFDNVGGDLMDRVIPALAPRARIVICGLMSAYTDAADAKAAGVVPLSAVMARGLSVTSFNNREHLARMGAFEQEITALIAAGKVRDRYNETAGLEGVIAHMATMFDDDSLGKRIAVLAP